MCARFSACRALKRKIASSVSFASISSVVCILDVFRRMMAVILNIMEVLEAWHGCSLSWVVGIGL